MPKKKRMANDPIVEELQAIKRLLMLQTLRTGATQNQIAAALGIDQSAVSRMIPSKAIRSSKSSKSN